MENRSRKSVNHLEMAMEKRESMKDREILRLRIALDERDEIINDHEAANERLSQKLVESNSKLAAMEHENGVLQAQLKMYKDTIRSVSQTIGKIDITGEGGNISSSNSSRVESFSEEEASTQPPSSSDSGRNSEEEEEVVPPPRPSQMLHASAVEPGSSSQVNRSIQDFHIHRRNIPDVQLPELQNQKEFPVNVVLYSNNRDIIKLKITGQSNFKGMLAVECKNDSDVDKIKKIKVTGNARLKPNSTVFICKFCGVIYYRSTSNFPCDSIENHIIDCRRRRIRSSTVL